MGLDPEIRAELDTLQRRVQQNDDELDAMQIAAAHARGTRWYREPAILISIMSLTLALGTTAISTIRLEEDRRHQARNELTGYIGRLVDIPKQQSDILTAGGANANNLIAQLNGELSSVASQARSDIVAIPEEVSTAEYLAVAYAFQSVGDFESADALYQQGLERARSSAEKIYSLRSLAALKFLAGDIDNGRKLMQQARDVHANDATTAPLLAASDDAQTELIWASSELTWSNCTEAQTHITAAQAIMAGQPLANLNGLLQQMVTGLSSCAPRTG